ncbi:MAG: response regulator [Gammaproteobacteria bacterium]|nr:response regulator [Gammaproteobacteria bacterium]
MAHFIKRPSAKILVTLAITLVVLSLHFAGMLVGLLPDADKIQRDGRAALAEALAIRTVTHLADSELDILEKDLQLVVQRNAELHSAVVRLTSGKELIRLGEHERYWSSVERRYSTDSQLTVPIMQGGQQWGQLELGFEPLRRAGWWRLLDSPWLQYSLYLAVIGFIAMYFVLGRMLRHLDPSKAVPARVRSALDTMMEGLLAIDLRGQVVLSNRAFSDLAGKSSEELLGTKIDDLMWEPVDDEALSGFRYPWEITLKEGRPSTSAQLHFIDGASKRRTFLVNCSPVMGGEGRHVGVLVGLGDVTELEEKEIELRLSKDRAEAANRAKSEFLANMSHEIRTPMNAILGFTEMLKRGYARSEDDNRKYLNTIHSSGKFLLELINDLLDLSKIEAGSMELERIRCPVQSVASEVVNTLSVKAAERGIKLEFTVDTPVPATVETDPLRLRQIITNLVGNAIKFTESGSVRVRLRYDAETAPEAIFIDVADTGIGMGPDQVEKIFDPFVQADRTITRRFGGTGLGLSISKRFSEALGGGIAVESTLGVGSVFTIHIACGSLADVPILSAEEAMQTAETTEEEVQTSWNFAQAHILVADDGKQNRELLRLFLQEHGLQVTEAENGQEALAAVSETHFDLILMDLEMPLMDGATATRKLRSAGVKVPIFALTAHSLQTVEQVLDDAGFSEYASKPIDMTALIDRLAKILGAVPVVSNSEATSTDDAQATSRLPGNDPRYRAIIAEFVEGLDERISAMKKAHNARDYEELAKLAHALKGVAGSVGFGEFTQPVIALETAAFKGAEKDVENHLGELSNLVLQAVSSFEPVQTKSSNPMPEPNVEALAGPPIRSCLPVADPQYRKILNDFIDEFDERFDAMDQALDQGDFVTLAQLAHGFIGVAGIVGFSEFTKPTRQLEAAAQAAQNENSRNCIAALRGLASRVESPDLYADTNTTTTDLVKSENTI